MPTLNEKGETESRVKTAILSKLPGRYAPYTDGNAGLDKIERKKPDQINQSNRPTGHAVPLGSARK